MCQMPTPNFVDIRDHFSPDQDATAPCTYHGVSKGQLQVYLDEFVFRHNRRKTPAAAFQTLLGLGTGRTSTEYEQIRRARDLNHNELGFAEATG